AGGEPPRDIATAQGNMRLTAADGSTREVPFDGDFLRIGRSVPPDWAVSWAALPVGVSPSIASVGAAPSPGLPTELRRAIRGNPTSPQG
ncbi:MAG: hypothetical protein E5X64_43905, partial [Mesorhizobium sp.]